MLIKPTRIRTRPTILVATKTLLSGDISSVLQTKVAMRFASTAQAIPIDKSTSPITTAGCDINSPKVLQSK